jgi:hypothetical protein
VLEDLLFHSGEKDNLNLAVPVSDTKHPSHDNCDGSVTSLHSDDKDDTNHCEKKSHGLS